MELRAEVVKLGPVWKHPNADSLEITHVFDYPVITKLGEFKEGDLAVYVPIDAVIPFVPEWEWLHQNAEKYCRVKAKRLRGVFSMGLLVPPSYLPRRYEAGEVVTDVLGIKKYEPPQPKAYRSLSAVGSSAPEVPGFVKYTDIENLLRWPDVLEDGEPVVLMEKIHGANFRCGWKDGKFHIGSHSTWRATDGTMRCPRCKGQKAKWWHYVLNFFTGGEHGTRICPKCSGAGKLVCDRSMGDVWNRVATARLLKELLEPFPGVEIFGEVYGASVQDLNYGFDGDKLGLYIFDAYDSTTGRYWDYHRLLDFLNGNPGFPLPPPIIYRGPWDARLKTMAQGQTLAGGDHIREGFVVRPVKERFHPRLGRVILKCISPDYLLRKGGTEGK